jgi:hypothetical protein
MFLDRKFFVLNWAVLRCVFSARKERLRKKEWIIDQERERPLILETSDLHLHIWSSSFLLWKECQTTCVILFGGRCLVSSPSSLTYSLVVTSFIRCPSSQKELEEDHVSLSLYSLKHFLSSCSSYTFHIHIFVAAKTWWSLSLSLSLILRPHVSFFRSHGYRLLFYV